VGQIWGTDPLTSAKAGTQFADSGRIVDLGSPKLVERLLGSNPVRVQLAKHYTIEHSKYWLSSWPIWKTCSSNYYWNWQVICRCKWFRWLESCCKVVINHHISSVINLTQRPLICYLYDAAYCSVILIINITLPLAFERLIFVYPFLFRYLTQKHCTRVNFIQIPMISVLRLVNIWTVL